MGFTLRPTAFHFKWVGRGEGKGWGLGEPTLGQVRVEWDEEGEDKIKI